MVDIECSPSQGSHLHIVLGHEDSKAAEVGTLVDGAVVSDAGHPAAFGGPMTNSILATLPENTAYLLPWPRDH